MQRIRPGGRPDRRSPWFDGVRETDMRALVITNMYPSERSPARGRFVADQVRALRALADIELELYAFEPGGAGAYLRCRRGSSGAATAAPASTSSTPISG